MAPIANGTSEITASGSTGGVYFPHLDDLVARVNSTLDAKQHVSIASWLETSEKHWEQYLWHKQENSIKGLDRIFEEFMLACTILTHKIPEHREFATFKSSSKLYSRYLQLARNVNIDYAYCEDVKREIKRNNEQSGVRSGGKLQKFESYATRRNKHTRTVSEQQINGPPHVVPKPHGLTSSPLLSGRSSSPANRNGASHHAKTSLDWSSRLEALRPGLSRTPLSPPSSLSDPTVGGTDRGLGLSVPPPLEGHIRAPSPTYSPARAFQPSSVPFPLTPGTPRPSPSIESGQTAHNGKTVEITQEETLSATELYDYLHKNVRILLIDVRDRELYDEAHISGDTVCIEPLVLREDTSGQDLENTAFVIVEENSQEEQQFKRRHEYDLVAFYDQRSTSPKASVELRRLVRIMVDFTYDKPLKHPPLLLEGGFDAWVELVGPSSPMISSSKTALPISSGAQPSNRFAYPDLEGTEHPTLNEMDGRETNGGEINIEEEQEFVSRLKNGSVTITMPSTDGDDVKRRRRGTSIVKDAGISRNYDDFFSKFPTSPIAQQSMSSQKPVSRNGLASPLKKQPIYDQPYYPFISSSSQLPPEPTRPPPAVPRKSYSGVSERVTPAIASDAPPLPPKLPTSSFAPTVSESSDVSIGRVGLKNLGNTCYMNSVVQCLSGTAPFSRFFIDGSFVNFINRENPLGSRGVLTRSLAEVIQKLWRNQDRFISPSTFREVVGRLNETFSTSDQQDSVEFLEFLLDGLHEDLNPHALHPKFKPLTEAEERNREMLPIQVVSDLEWRKHIKLNYSLVVFWFQGQLASRLCCLTCQTTSTTYNTFNFLSIPIPRKPRCTLQECIEEFLKEEIMDGDDAWQCPTCKKPRKATKKLTITRLPSILIIHLKRFINNGKWRDKLNNWVDFPLRGLELTDYVPPLDGSFDAPGHWTPDEQWKGQQIPPFQYDLHAVCNHYGTLNGGHYTALVHDAYHNVWNNHDDSKTSTVSEEDVVTKSAYVLFYKRQDIM